MGNYMREKVFETVKKNQTLENLEYPIRILDFFIGYSKIGRIFAFLVYVCVYPFMSDCSHCIVEKKLQSAEQVHYL